MSSHLGEKNRIYRALASLSAHPTETKWNKPYIRYRYAKRTTVSEMNLMRSSISHRILGLEGTLGGRQVHVPA